MNDKTELLPCPHCEKPVRFLHDMEGIPQGVFCPKCRMLVKYTDLRADERIGFKDLMEKIAARWNERPKMTLKWREEIKTKETP